MQDEALAKFEEHIRGGLAASGVRAKVITSGHGGWKYVDIVSAQAGKLESLEHVRRQLGFGLAATVACGDSGNDILMLSGENRALVVGNAQPDLLKWVESGGNKARALRPDAMPWAAGSRRGAFCGVPMGRAAQPPAPLPAAARAPS